MKSISRYRNRVEKLWNYGIMKLRNKGIEFALRVAKVNINGIRKMNRDIE
jgi:hypothetical protein